MSTMNWKKETRSDFEVYPAGTYHVRVVNWERLTASTGTKQIRWRAEIISPDKYKGKTILDHTALTENSLWRICRAVNALGVDTSESPNMDTEGAAFDAVLNSCKERKVFWHIVEETYNGQQRNKVADYQPDPEQENIKPQSPVDW